MTTQLPNSEIITQPTKRGRPRKSPSTRLAEPPKKTKQAAPSKNAPQPENLSPQNPAKNKRTWSAKQRRSPRHTNSCRRILRIGQMAWEGRSAGEIADELSVSVQHVYHLCSFYRIELSKKTKAEYAFRSTISLTTLAALEKLAERLEIGVQELAAQFISILAAEPAIAVNLITEARLDAEPDLDAIDSLDVPALPKCNDSIFKSARIDMGMSIDRLSRLTGVGKAAITNIENGKTQLSLNSVILAKELKIPLEKAIPDDEKRLKSIDRYLKHQEKKQTMDVVATD